MRKDAKGFRTITLEVEVKDLTPFTFNLSPFTFHL
jgi:hypothetical protein